MEIILASLGQQVQIIMNQESILLLNVTLKDTTSKCILQRHRNDIDTLTNALRGSSTFRDENSLLLFPEIEFYTLV